MKILWESPNFSLIFVRFITPGASLGTYMSMHTNSRHFWAHLRHLTLGGKLCGDLNFSLNFCWVYHTSSTLRHMYGLARQLEAIMGTFEIGFCSKNQRTFSLSLIMAFIMGGSEFFSKFLSGLSHQRRPRACVWACTPTRGDCGHI